MAEVMTREKLKAELYSAGDAFADEMRAAYLKYNEALDRLEGAAKGSLSASVIDAIVTDACARLDVKTDEIVSGG